MQQIFDTRRANLKLQVDAAGDARRLASQLGIHETRVSQLLSGEPRWTMSEKVARKYEGLLELPMGWFDAPHTSAHDTAPRPPPVAPPPLSLDSDLLALTTQAVLEAVAPANLAAPKIATIIALAYQRAAEIGALDPAHIKTLLKLVR